MAKSYVKLWESYRSYFEPLGAAEVGRLVLAMMDYKSSGAEPEFSGSEKFIWPAIKRDLDEDIAYTARQSEHQKASRSKRKQADTSDCKCAQVDASESQSIKNKDVGRRNKDVGNRTEDSLICAEPEPASTPPIIELPLNDGNLHPISQEQCQEWAGLYPAVDVIQQLRQMKGWLDSNPQKRKTKRGIKAFCTRWLCKEQDKGGIRQSDLCGDHSKRQLNVTRL